MFFGEPFGGIIPGARGAVLAVLLRTDAPLTGRQIHGLLKPQHSLGAVQEALKALALLGLVETRTVGRAGVHVINERHAAVPHLRALVDPIATLEAAVREVGGPDVDAIIVFGSIARGEATRDSDVDLAVIAPRGWDRRHELEETVRDRLGNGCDVLVFSADEFQQLARDGEPVVRDILRDGVALVGTKPRLTTGVT